MNHSSQRGNVLFYILIAIVAFAALSFAVSRSGRESVSTVDKEKSELATTEILDFTTALRSNMQNMAIQGVKPAQMCFDTPTYGTTYQYAACSTVKNKVFDKNGGNAPAPHSPSNSVLNSKLSAMTGYGIWTFPNTIQVKGVGSDCASDAYCNELVAVLFPLKDEVCKALNNKMGIANPDNIPVNLSAVTYTPYLGSFVYSSIIESAALNGKRTGCFRNNDGSNVFYAVLIAN